MASTTLCLKDPKSNSTTRVFCLLRDGRSVRIKIYSDFSISPKHWGKSKTVLSANNNATSINKGLLEFKNRVLQIYTEAKAQGLKANAKYIKDVLKPKEDAVTQSTKFWNVWEYYLIAKKNRYQSRSFVKFKSLSNHLEKFETYDKIPLELDIITKKTFERLQDYFYTVAGLNTQTTSKYLDLFKVFLNWAYAEQYTSNRSYSNFQSIKQPDTLKVVMSESDIAKIEKKKLEVDYLINVRELFLLSTLTGLRYSDYSRISKEHIKTGNDGNKFLQLRMEKTGTFVEIPLTNQAETIINKILTGEVHPISNQKMNLYVKELCKKAEINETFEVHEYKGKLSVSKKVPKYELITTHTGRRTFATRLLLKGVPSQVVMKFTGHKDYKSFEKYVNIPKQTEMDMVTKALLG